MEVGSVRSGGNYETKLCLSCELPECQPTSVKCPLRQKNDDNMRKAYNLICRHSIDEPALRKTMRLKKADMVQILERLQSARLIKQKNEEWVKK